ncbi:50S ribosomal protein L3 [endosymbiont of Sipalinus gigas]|uniref:50S ribosomal protein L3 n=1 Tax=endosymbiont of Sipalinus gigas TaxID=1972134 RepID=UPI000DC6D987|nr:50S ribosomal protein L3 [endosymbiont of Sipalinus gigas]
MIIIGNKIGMTRLFLNDGMSIPITILKIYNNFITYIKNNSLQITVESNIKIKKINKSIIGHYKASNISPGIGLWEYKLKLCENISDFKIGQKLSIDNLINVDKVNITGISKGKGFSGVIKRWNFKMQDASHGNSLSHRAPGSIGQNQSPGRVFKGKKMAGHHGNYKKTIKNLKIMYIDSYKNIVAIKGSIPGSNNKNVIINFKLNG